MAHFSSKHSELGDIGVKVISLHFQSMKGSDGVLSFCGIGECCCEHVSKFCSEDFLIALVSSSRC